MKRGWISLWRRLWDNPRSADSEWLAVWVYILTHATHRVIKKVFDGKIVELQPGQLITGRHTIADATGVNESKVTRVLTILKTDQQIDQQAGVKGSIITVLNWQRYQKSDQEIDQRVTSDRPATDQRVTTNNNRIINTTEKQDKTTTPPDGVKGFVTTRPRKPTSFNSPSGVSRIPRSHRNNSRKPVGKCGLTRITANAG